jgi:hypothetical protein
MGMSYSLESKIETNNSQLSEQNNEFEEIIYKNNDYIIKKPKNLNYRIYDNLNNRCVTFEMKNDSIYIHTMKFLECEKDCNLTIQDLQNILIDYAKKNDKKYLELFDSPYTNIYYGNLDKKEHYNSIYIYLFIDASKPSYYIKNFNYIFMYNHSPIYEYIINNLISIVEKYKNNEMHMYVKNYEMKHTNGEIDITILNNVKNITNDMITIYEKLEKYSQFCYHFNKKKIEKNILEQTKYNNYTKEINMIAPLFKTIYKLFQEYIDYYIENTLKKYILESYELYNNDVYYIKLYKRATKSSFKLSTIFNDELLYIIN